MEADDFFADEVEVGGPEPGELLLRSSVISTVAEGGHVVGEGVEPDVDDVLFFGFVFVLNFTGDGDSPGEG